MVFYKDTLSDGTPGDCQESNMLCPTESLMKAMRDNVPFVLLSRATVFDMSRGRVYNEKSMVNGSSVAGKTLRIMEDKVLDYEYGYVIRACNIISDLMPELLRMSLTMPPKVSPRVLRPVSMRTIDYIADVVHTAEWGDRKKIIHVPMMQPQDLAGILYRMAGYETEFDISEDGVDVSECYNGVLDSTCFESVMKMGSMERVDCIYINDFFTNIELYGGQP